MSFSGTHLWSDSWDLESSVVSLFSRNHGLIFFFICSLMACRDVSILQGEIQLWECRFFDFLGFLLV